MALAKLGHAAIDENGNISGGKLGDNNGHEVCVVDFFNTTGKEWAYVYRCNDKAKRNLLASAMQQASDNNHIGYDQSKRYTLWNEMFKTGNISLIKNDCACDCSSLVSCCVQIVGIPSNMYMSTSNEREFLNKSGYFTEIPFTLGMNLETGDILWRNGHTAICVNGGETLIKKEPNIEVGHILYVVSVNPLKVVRINEEIVHHAEGDVIEL